MPEMGKPICEFCDNKPAIFIDHWEGHLAVPRKINICGKCHLRIHSLPLSEQYSPFRIRIPRSWFPMFKQLYANMVDAHGNLILSGELLFTARYEVVDDKDWNPKVIPEILTNPGGRPQ